MSPRQKPFYTVLIRYPTWYSGSWKNSNGYFWLSVSTFSQSL